MEGHNKLTREEFLKGVSHPRKKELAEMLLDGKSKEEMVEAGYGRINILEMAREISRNVEDKKGFSVDFPRKEAAAESDQSPEQSKNVLGADDSTVEENPNDQSSDVNSSEPAHDAEISEPVEEGTLPTGTANAVGSENLEGQSDAEKADTVPASLETEAVVEPKI